MHILKDLAADFRRNTDELRFVPRDLLRTLKNNWLALFSTLMLAVALNRVFLWLSVALSFVHPILSSLTFPLAALSIMGGAIAAVWTIEKDLIHLRCEETKKNGIKHLLHSAGALMLPFVGIYVTTGWFADDFLDRRMPLIELQTENYLRPNPLQLAPTPDERSTILVFCSAILLRFLLKWSGASRKNVVYAWGLAYCEVLWTFTLTFWFKELMSGTAILPQKFHFWDWWESGKLLFAALDPLKDGLVFLFSTVLLLPITWIMFVQIVLQKTIYLEENSPLPKTRDEWATAPKQFSRQAFTVVQVTNETVLLLVALSPLATTLICLYFNLFWIPENLWRWLLDLVIGPVTESGARFYIKSSLLPFGKVLALLVTTTLSCIIADRCQGNMINNLRRSKSH